MSIESKKSESKLRLFILGPGVGESIVIQLPDGQWGVVDCFQPKPGQGFGTLDFLKKRGVRKLAFFCHTHPHEDHFLGSADLLTAFSSKISRIWRHPGFSTRDITTKMLLATKAKARTKKDPEANNIEREYSRLLMALCKERAYIAPENYRRVIGSGPLINGKQYQISSLGPQSGVLEQIEERLAQRNISQGFIAFNDDEGGIVNNLSVTLHITFGKADIFLLADAQGKNLHIHPHKRHCTLVKIAHHGSDNGLASNRITTCPKDYNIGNAVMTPFSRSRLPNPSMLSKYSKSCTQLRLTSNDPIQPAQAAILGLMLNQETTTKRGWLGLEIWRTGRVTECDF